MGNIAELEEERQCHQRKAVLRSNLLEQFVDEEQKLHSAINWGYTSSNPNVLLAPNEWNKYADSTILEQASPRISKSYSRLSRAKQSRSLPKTKHL